MGKGQRGGGGAAGESRNSPGPGEGSEGGGAGGPGGATAPGEVVSGGGGGGGVPAGRGGAAGGTRARPGSAGHGGGGSGRGVGRAGGNVGAAAGRGGAAGAGLAAGEGGAGVQRGVALRHHHPRLPAAQRAAAAVRPPRAAGPRLPLQPVRAPGRAGGGGRGAGKSRPSPAGLSRASLGAAFLLASLGKCYERGDPALAGARSSRQRVQAQFPPVREVRGEREERAPPLRLPERGAALPARRPLLADDQPAVHHLVPRLPQRHLLELREVPHRPRRRALQTLQPAFRNHQDPG